VTAEDVVWNMEMQFNYPTAWEAIQYPPTKPEKVTGKVLPGDPRRPTSFKALDKYTVEVKVPAESQGIMLLEIGDNAYTNPPECWVGPDAKGMTDWHNVVGSGPWIVSDYVSGSAVTYIKNPDYFETDPLYPGKNYKWPYADSFVSLIITDAATRLSALRTGKLDYSIFNPDDAKPILAQNKDLRYVTRSGAYQVLSGRMDKENLPFKDKKVRYALNMAVNKQEILEDYWKGQAVLIGYPYAPRGFEGMFAPLEELPADIQELWHYNPEKAKQLLKEAGYPNGFKTKVQVANNAAFVDECAMLKNYLAKVNVDLEIEVMEVGAWNAMDTANSQDEMWYGTAKGIWNAAEQLMVRPNTVANDSMINDPYFAEVGTIIARDVIKNPANYKKTMKASGIYELGTAWGVWMPVPYEYNIWWPWLKNYEGIFWTGWAGISDWTKSIWIDQKLKKSMGY
jgi:peptide/nickel transport system substrate-binding protein